MKSQIFETEREEDEPSTNDRVTEVMDEVGERGVWFRSVVLLAIDTDIQMHTRSKTFETPVQDGELASDAVEELLDAFLASFDGELRRTGPTTGRSYWRPPRGRPAAGSGS